jgi:ribose transport system ATP-binding protein
MSSAVFKLSNISKTFPGVKALSHIDFELLPGEVHCICGENGAGKSTLIKIISGAYQPDKGGSIEFEGKARSLNPRAAMELGIQTIYQEHNNFPHLSVMENIFVGLEITDKGIMKRKEMREKTQEVLDYLHCRFSPDVLVGELSSGEKKLVEIAKAIVFQRKIIILDEPTSSLSASEIDMLLDVVKKVSKKGISIVYISHHLEEVFRIADRITILRDGMKILTCGADEIDEPRLIHNMVGRDVSAFYSREFFEPGDVALEAKNLTGNGVRNISFNVRRGEIVGFAGMVGSGRSELMALLMGAARKYGGDLYIEGQKVNFKNPSDAIKNKMCFITEDRQYTGLFLEHTIARNTIIANMVNNKKTFFSPKDDIKVGNEYIKKMNIKANDASDLVVNLSGGNQQKVVLSKWFNTNGDIFIFDEPTLGIDVGAKQEIYKIMMELLRDNKAIIMVSSDMPEVVSLSDRVIVMRDGAISGELEGEEVSEENILQYSIGGSKI